MNLLSSCNRHWWYCIVDAFSVHSCLWIRGRCTLDRVLCGGGEAEDRASIVFTWLWFSEYWTANMNRDTDKNLCVYALTGIDPLLPWLRNPQLRQWLKTLLQSQWHLRSHSAHSGFSQHLITTHPTTGRILHCLSLQADQSIWVFLHLGLGWDGVVLDEKN